MDGTTQKTGKGREADGRRWQSSSLELTGGRLPLTVDRLKLQSPCVLSPLRLYTEGGGERRPATSPFKKRFQERLMQIQARKGRSGKESVTRNSQGLRATYAIQYLGNPSGPLQCTTRRKAIPALTAHSANKSKRNYIVQTERFHREQASKSTPRPLPPRTLRSEPCQTNISQSGVSEGVTAVGEIRFRRGGEDDSTSRGEPLLFVLKSIPRDGGGGTHGRNRSDLGEKCAPYCEG